MFFSVAQVNPTIGDLVGNVALCLEAAERGRRDGADLVILPEMVIPGYPPRDLLYDPSFVAAIEMANQDLARQTADGPPLLVGSTLQGDLPGPHHPGLLNVALLMQRGEITVVAEKQLLPGYDVFFEPRWFVPGRPLPPFELNGTQIGVLICEDLWDDHYPISPAQQLIDQRADLLITLSASPFRQGIMRRRLDVARQTGCNLIYVNSFGCHDELLFDGGSFGMNRAGEKVAQLSRFVTDQQLITFDLEHVGRPATTGAVEDEIGILHQALVAGLRDFCEKNRQREVVIGLSGGIDSAVVAVLATEALGPDRVTGIAIPSRYTDPCSTEAAARLAKNLGIAFEVVSLEKLHQAAIETMGEMPAEGTAAENIQVRLRTMILMGVVNQKRGMLLNTSNKTELALGYATLYGDMAGGFSPLGDVTKPRVYALAKWINREQEVIPRFIVDRPPSAELMPDQVDPFDYKTVAPTLEAVIQTNQTNPVLMRSEHKRRQFGIILKLSEKGFGSGRMVPVTRK